MQTYKSTLTGNIYQIEPLSEGLVNVVVKSDDPELNGHEMILDKHCLNCLNLEEIK